MRRPVPPGERGAALLAVLLLVAVMGALTAGALEKLRLSTALAANGAALGQARAFAIGIESLATLRIDDLIAADPERTLLAGGWNGETKGMPLPAGGTALVTVHDGGNCFNINSVADGRLATALTPRAAGIAQFASLMRLLGIPDGTARRIAAAAGDWVDSDGNPAPEGAEDRAYAGAEQPYRAANTYFADASELRVLNGMTPEIYARVRPWICALPATSLSPININTLSPAQAPLLAMLAPERIDLETARRVIARRPTDGWTSLDQFWNGPGMEGVVLPLDVRLQPQLRSRWFEIDLAIELRGAELRETALVDARLSPSRVVARRWGSDD